MRDTFYIKNNIPVNIVRSKRKTISIQVRLDGDVIVRAPQRISTRQIRSFVLEKEEWILKHIEDARRQQSIRKTHGGYSEAEISAFTKQAKKMIPDRVSHYAKQMGVSYGRITIRCQKTRWGSCSAKGNLNFNCLLMAMPSEILDYVIVHELCHLLEMNHSARFWAQVEQVLPDYRERRRWLKEHGKDYSMFLHV